MAGSWANHPPATSAFTKVARNNPSGADVYSNAPASTRLSSGTTSATIAEPAAHSPPIPRLAMMRQMTSCHSSVTNAQDAVPMAYSTMVIMSTRLRPKRSLIGPNSTPPAAQPSSSSELRMPFQYGNASLASCPPIGTPNNVGIALGATKLNSSPSKMSNPQPSQAA